MKGLGFLSGVSEDPLDKLKRIQRRQEREKQEEEGTRPRRRPRKMTEEENRNLDAIIEARAAKSKMKDGQHLHGRAAKGRPSYANERSMSGKPIREDRQWKYRRDMEEMDAKRPTDPQEVSQWHTRSFDELLRRGYTRDEAFDMMQRANKGNTR